MTKALLPLLITIAFTGCNSDESGWENLIKDNSLQGWHIFQDTGSKKGWIVEDDILILTDTLSVTEQNYTMSVGRYSGSALYLVGIDTVLAIDGDKISTDHESYCEGDCWHVDDAELNLEL